MFHLPLGSYCSFCAGQVVTGTSERKPNQTLQPSGRHTVYLIHHLSGWKYIRRRRTSHPSLNKNPLSSFVFLLVDLFLVVDQQRTDDICIWRYALVVAQVAPEKGSRSCMWSKYSKYKITWQEQCCTSGKLLRSQNDIRWVCTFLRVFGATDNIPERYGRRVWVKFDVFS